MKENPFSQLNKFDKILYIISVIIIGVCFVCSQQKNYLTLISSIMGVTCLVFVVKGQVLGQCLSVIFAFVYAFTSYFFGYYGECIIYAFMSMPIALITIFSWLAHPHKKRKEVEVGEVNFKQIVIMLICAIIVGIAFYFILKLFNTANLVVSAISVSTSFMGLYLSVLRSPYYALAYMLNDIVLIALWVSATIVSLSYLPLVICFCVFLVYDIYGFFSWKSMAKQQIIDNN